jgi:radical SAM protein with 4Fe4S-binding SPASM domain
MNNYRKGNTVLPPPVFMWIEPTNYCNLKCVMCSNSVLKDKDVGFMKFSLYKKIIDEVKDYIGSCFLFNSGESLFHKDIVRMIDYAEENGIRVQLHTNATILDRKMRHKMLNSKLSYILFSFDGLTKEYYEKIRINANFENTLDNVRSFLNERDDKPYTVIQNIIIDSVMDKDTFKTDFLNFYSSFDKLPDDIIIKYPIDMSDDKLRKNIDFTLFNPNKQVVKCPMVWCSSVIRWNGDVVACPFDFTGEINIGNVSEDSFIDVWNGNEMKKLRRGLAPNKCNNCVCTQKGTFLGLSIELWKILSFYLANRINYGMERMFSKMVSDESSQYVIMKGKDYRKVNKTGKVIVQYEHGEIQLELLPDDWIRYKRVDLV